MYFALPKLVCANTTVLDYTKSMSIFLDATGNHHLLVNSCPQDADKNITDKCVMAMSPQKHLSSPVVTSKGFPVSYWNTYCALCNGESAIDVDEWSLSINCGWFADFNFLSTIQSIIDLANERDCRFRYQSLTPELVTVCDPDRPTMKNWTIGSCNQTGSWRSYDETIEIACHASYEVPYRLYKNVFCYMCNPPRYMPRDIIDSCNTTHLWSPPDVKLGHACTNYTSSQYTMPFKNIFCFLCNRINNKNFTYLEAQTHATEVMETVKLSFYEGIFYPNGYSINRYVYEFDTLLYRMQYLMYLYRRFPIEHWNKPLFPEDLTNVRIYGVSRNITNLADKHFATFPYANYCQREMLPLQFAIKGGHMCSCEDSCVFYPKYGKCCVDKSVTTPVSCISDRGLKNAPPIYEPWKTDWLNKKMYLVIDGCDPRVQNNVMRNRCESDSIEDLYSFLPFDIKAIYGQAVQYRNIDCALCRKIIQEVNDKPEVNVTYSSLEEFLLEAADDDSYWDISITCDDEVLETEHNVLLFDVIRLAEYLGCYVHFAKKLECKLQGPGCSSSVKCLVGTYINEPICNTTGKWPVYDADVQWACENTTHDALPQVASHKNYFCYLCNPDIDIVDVIDTCNVTGNWHTNSPLIERACELFPRIYSKYQYKNSFCEKCNTGDYSLPSVKYDNGRAHGESDTDILDQNGQWGFEGLYRNIFSLASYDDKEHFDPADLCSNKQIYDVHKVCKYFIL